MAAGAAGVIGCHAASPAETELNSGSGEDRGVDVVKARQTNRLQKD
jgi:hypothetical protein